MTYTVDFQQAVRNFREAYEENLRNRNHICNTIQPGIDFIEHRFVQLLSDMTSEFQAMRGRIVACDRHPEEGDAGDEILLEKVGHRRPRPWYLSGICVAKNPDANHDLS